MFTNVTYISPQLKTIQMSINWWMNNTMWYIHTMDCSAIKRNKLLIHVQRGQAWKFPPLLALRGTRTSVLFLSVISRSSPKHRLTPIFCGVPVWGFPFPTPSWHLIKAQVLPQTCSLPSVSTPPASFRPLLSLVLITETTTSGCFDSNLAILQQIGLSKAQSCQASACLNT